jgi:peroxiredoxin
MAALGGVPPRKTFLWGEMKMRNRIAFSQCLLGGFLGFVSACVGEVPLEPVDEVIAPADGTGDGEKPGDGETPINVESYPAGPYGTSTGKIAANMVLTGQVDDDGDTYAANDEPRDFELAEYFKGADPDAKVIMMTISATWCGPCQIEATHQRNDFASYQPKGGRMFTVLVDGSPAKVKSWADKYDLPMPVVSDPNAALTGGYFDATPTNVFIDAKNMKILKKVVGEGYQDVMEHYLDTL